MDLEAIVQQILTSRHDLTREEVLKKIYDKKQSAEDYFLDEVAARIVASELGVEIPSTEEKLQPEIAIKHLVSGLNDVTVAGRVISLYPIQTFTRPDLSIGKVSRLLIADKTGRLKIVLWNEQAELAETGKIRPGNIIRVLHGYVREGYDGRLELQCGQRAQIEVSPTDLTESDYPLRDQFVDKIGDLTQKIKRTSILGVISEVYSASEFKRRDGSGGKVRRLRLRDETGEIPAVFWNQKVDELGEVQVGEQLRLTEARVKTQPDGRIELHVENSVQTEKLAGKAEIPPITATAARRPKIRELTEGGPFTIEATVASAPNVREVTTGQGERITVASFDLADETGKIGMTLWRKHAESAGELQSGTRVKIRNAYAKRGFSNLLELFSRTSTVIEIVAKAEVVGAGNKLE